MIIGPNHELPVLRADEVARLLRRALRAKAGDRRAEIVSVGAGQVDAPADIVSDLDVAGGDLGFTEDEVILVGPGRADLDALAGFVAPPAGDTGRADYDAAAADRIAREAATQAQAEADAAAAQAAAQLPPADDAEAGTVNVAADAGATPAAPPAAPKPKKGKKGAAPVDPSDRTAFPNIDALVDYARTNGIDVAGLTKRGDLEAAIANPTTK